MKPPILLIGFLFFMVSPIVLPAQNYELATPTKITQLPAILREVSGISVINNNLIACVQDEKGILFQFNIKKEAIAQQDSFYVDGDYEGIAKVGNDIYVLRSDGVLLEIDNALKGKTKVVKHITHIPATDNEGLCYDEANNRLLIASKSKALDIVDAKNKRMIYAFDLTTKELEKSAVIEIYIPTIKKFVADKYGMSEYSMNKFKFKPSAISINPVDGKLYLLAASSFLLCIFKDSVFESAERLDPLIFKQAEGICFFKNGDMLISNEGQSGNASLLFFTYKK